MPEEQFHPQTMVQYTVQYQCHKVGCYTYHQPTYHLLAAKKATKNKGNTKKPISRIVEKSLKKFLESRQEGDWAKSRKKRRRQKEQQDKVE